MHPGRYIAAVAFGLAAAVAPAISQAQSTVPLTDAEMEQFLRKARVASTKRIGVGVTESRRATLTDGSLTHDAHVQVVDAFKSSFQTQKGIERNFRDSWRYNVAAYKLDRLLGLQMVPVSIERSWNGNAGAFSWWVDDVMLDEKKRLEVGTPPPNAQCWGQQAQAIRMFDQLIQNTDRNLGNTLISSTWKVWAIDHTRAFRESSRPENMKQLVSVDRDVLQRMAALDRKTLDRELGKYLSGPEIGKLLQRRDALVEHYRSLGEQALITRIDPASGRCAATATDGQPPQTTPREH